MVDCEYFEIIDWNEDTNEIYHAVCTMPSACWANCGSCTDRVPVQPSDSHVCMGRWIFGKTITLTRDDVDILDGSRNRTVRVDQMEDAQVKNLYDMYKSL